MSKHGENIRKRKDGRWEGRYIKGRKSDRTAIWGYIYGHSYTEVKEKLAIKKMEVQQFVLNVDNPTFSELSLTWESSIFLGVKSSTAAHYLLDDQRWSRRCHPDRYDGHDAQGHLGRLLQSGRGVRRLLLRCRYDSECHHEHDYAEME